MQAQAPHIIQPPSRIQGIAAETLRLIQMSTSRELRFTRSGQARIFWICGAVFAACAMVLAVVALERESNPSLPHGLWACVPLLLSMASIWLAIRLTRHAFMVLTLNGIEIYPFLRPAADMRLVLWHEIHSAEVDDSLSLLTLHFDADKTSGLHVVLVPVRKDRRRWLADAITARLTR